jgi:DNA-directed RNA polymerase subunit RPC12/RpoP
MKLSKGMACPYCGRAIAVKPSDLKLLVRSKGSAQKVRRTHLNQKSSPRLSK